MSSDNPSVDTIRDQAAQWAARLHDSDLSDAEREELHRWLLADPRHANEFRAHNAVLGLAHEFSSDIHARLSAYAPVSSAVKKSNERRWVLPAALAATMLLAFAVGGWFFLGRPQLVADAYATHTGQLRTVLLEDGSVAYLNTRTQIKWKSSTRDRRVELLEGEVLFDVVPDPNRPFRVLMDNSEVRVLGTRFNVYRKKDGETAVTVIDGLVEVHERGQGDDHPAWQRRLSANQQIVYRPLGVTQDVRETAGMSAVKWREGVMEIQDRPLPEVLEELTRYTDQRIVIRNPILNQVRVGGVLSVRDVHVALARLQKLAPIAVTESDGTFTLDYRAE